MDLGLAGKTAIVTGGSAGIGRACAAALHDEGVHVALVARDPVRLKDAAAAIAARASAAGDAAVIPVGADLSKAADVERAVAAAVDRL